MTEEAGYYYLLVGILSSEYDGDRSFAKLHGYSEVLPGQITTDRIRSASGGSYIDLQNGNMQLGEKLKYIDGVLTLNFLFSEGANIGGFIFRNGRLESVNGATWLDGVNGKMLLSGGFSGNITADSLTLSFEQREGTYTLKVTDPTNIMLHGVMSSCDFTLPVNNKKFHGKFLNLFWNPKLTRMDGDVNIHGSIYCPNKSTLTSDGFVNPYHAKMITSKYGGIMQLVNIEGRWVLLNGTPQLEYTSE